MRTEPTRARKPDDDRTNERRRAEARASDNGRKRTPRDTPPRNVPFFIPKKAIVSLRLAFGGCQNFSYLCLEFLYIFNSKIS